MAHLCGYFLGASFSKICSFTTMNLNVNVFCGGKSSKASISRSFVAAIYQNKPLSPVSFFNCRNGLFLDVLRREDTEKKFDHE